jgi:hypothetical protein
MEEETPDKKTENPLDNPKLENLSTDAKRARSRTRPSITPTGFGSLFRNSNGGK